MYFLGIAVVYFYLYQIHKDSTSFNNLGSSHFSRKIVKHNSVAVPRNLSSKNLRNTKEPSKKEAIRFELFKLSRQQIKEFKERTQDAEPEGFTLEAAV